MEDVMACARALVQMAKSGKSSSHILRELKREGYSKETINKALDQMR